MKKNETKKTNNQQPTTNNQNFLLHKKQEIFHKSKTPNNNSPKSNRPNVQKKFPTPPLYIQQKQNTFNPLPLLQTLQSHLARRQNACNKNDRRKKLETKHFWERKILIRNPRHNGRSPTNNQKPTTKNQQFSVEKLLRIIETFK